MIVAGHQPNYLPYLGFFHKLANCDRFMIVDTVQFVKRGEFGWSHRNRLRSAEGWQWISLPVLSKGKREQTCADAELNNNIPWRRKHWSAIEYNYRNAPHFKEYAPPLKEVFDREWTHLTPLAAELIRVCARIFGIETPIELASQAGVGGEAHDLLTNICRYYGSDTYFSGVHGRDYLDLALMKERGVAIQFQEFVHPTYRQCQKGDFIPYLSAIDLIFNEGANARDLLLNKP